MSRKLFLVITLSVLSVSTALIPTPVWAEIPLTFADIQALLRQVRLQPKNSSPRPAKVRERMAPGDALSTARSSRADLRFNDGSLARVGELALFRFFPNTRRFNLSNGTALLLIPPGRGTTNVTTPNVSAGIRGSALFVRVDRQTNTTIVGALTNSGITVTDNGTNRLVELKAGQMAVVDPKGLRLFDFDLTTFYQTSDMVRGLNLDQKPSGSDSNQGIAAVQGETSEALGKQEKIQDEKLVQNPDFIRLSPQPSGFPDETRATPPIAEVQVPIKQPGAPESFTDRGILSPGQTTSSNPAMPSVAAPSLGTLPSDPKIPDKLPVTPTPTPAPTPGLIPIEKDPVGSKAPDPELIKPTPVPITPTPAPVQITPAPVQITPTPAPIQITPVPITPTPAPIQITPVPITPTPAPVQITPAPVQITPTPAPIQITPAPVVAPVTPQLLEVVPKTPTAIQIVPSPTPNAAPTVPANYPSTSPATQTPSLAPTLAPTTAPVLPVDATAAPTQSQSKT